MNDLKLSGITHASGGRYGDVKIEGIANINGDIVCSDVNVKGVSSFSGGLECSGISIEGTCNISGDVSAGECRLSGLLNTSGDFSSESFRGTGSFKIGGALNSGNIDIKFVYGSSSSEVLGENITIRKEGVSGATEFIMDLIPWRHKGKSFKCGTIEGDIINLEHVEAEVVRGKSVRIGPGCKVGLVEYHDIIDISPDARVEKHDKLEG